MGFGKKLDVAGSARWKRLVAAAAALALAPIYMRAASDSAGEQICVVKKLYESKQWEEVVAATAGAPDSPGDFGLYRGLALARLERWAEARNALEASLTHNPNDTRLMTELAGLAYREKRFKEAKKCLRSVLKNQPYDEYANDLLGSIYFFEGNLDAALEYWNKVKKPQLSDLSFEPEPKLKPILLDRTFAFSRGGVWTEDAFLTSKARLEKLGVFQARRFDLEANDDGTFNLLVRATEKPSWLDSPWIAAAGLASGLPYQTVYAEFPSVNRNGVQWNSSYRWDDQKRRVTSELAAPLKDNPAWRFRFGMDWRDENWNLSTTLVPKAPGAASVNLEKATARMEIESIVSGRWSWSSGVNVSDREMRSLTGLPAAATTLFADGANVGLYGELRGALLRRPERRFTIDGRANGELGTFFKEPLGRYTRLGGELDSRWLPRATGEDYETRVRLRGGRIFGDVPFDELYVLGFDRDTDLWMRGHPGLAGGQKGAAPLGNGYMLVNAEVDKIVYKAPFVLLRAGPFLDTGKAYASSSGYFGSPEWMWDSGAQLKARLFGSFEFVLGYGRDLRSGRNSFFTTVLRRL
jgi:tetratricopeptide (TPR) repeat protein